jgi:ribosome-binding ATPase YchF (GTP1/OBG family)
MLADFVVLEKRLERMEADQKRGKAADPEELSLVKACLAELEQERPLRHRPELASAPQLRGFTLLSAKPMMVLLQQRGRGRRHAGSRDLADRETCLLIRASWNRSCPR